jgi:hypothetical protein
MLPVVGAQVPLVVGMLPVVAVASVVVGRAHCCTSSPAGSTASM